MYVLHQQPHLRYAEGEKAEGRERPREGILSTIFVPGATGENGCSALTRLLTKGWSRIKKEGRSSAKNPLPFV